MTCRWLDSRVAGVFVVLVAGVLVGCGGTQTYEDLQALAAATLEGVDSVRMLEESSMDLNGMAMVMSARAEVMAPSYSRTEMRSPMMNLELWIDGETTVTVFTDQKKFMRTKGLPFGDGASDAARAAEGASMALDLERVITSLTPLPGTMLEDLGTETLELNDGHGVACRVMLIDAEPEAAFGGTLRPGATVKSAKLWMGKDDGLVYRNIVVVEMVQGGATMTMTNDTRVLELDLAPGLTAQDFVFVPEAGMDETSRGKQFVEETLEGKPAPAVSLTDHHGAATTLKSHLDGVTVVDFWATWCGPCRQELDDLKAAMAAGSFDAPVVLISSEDEPVVSAYVKEHDLPMTSLLDPGGTATAAFEVKGYPTIFVVRPDGTIADHFVGKVEVSVLREAVEKARGAS